MLLAAGARLDYTDATGNNALMEAALVGKLDTIPVLVEAGIGPNARTNNGSTALIGAAQEGEWEAVKLQLELGADPLMEITSGPGAGQTALALAWGAEHVGTALALEVAEMRELRLMFWAQYSELVDYDKPVFLLEGSRVIATGEFVHDSLDP